MPTKHELSDEERIQQFLREMEEKSEKYRRKSISRAKFWSRYHLFFLLAYAVVAVVLNIIEFSWINLGIYLLGMTVSFVVYWNSRKYYKRLIFNALIGKDERYALQYVLIQGNVIWKYNGK